MNIDSIVVAKRMKYLKSLCDHYWTRFQEEYLLELRAQHIQGSNPCRQIEVGEIVIIDGKTKRNYWRLGKVVSLIPGSDGRVRAVVLKTFDGTRANYMKRPIEKLYPIEVKAVHSVDQSKIDEAMNTLDQRPTGTSNEHPISTNNERREPRIAAENGILVRRLLGQF